MPGPLDGIRVLEVANWLAAPAATALMADMGADVIKVEPPAGDVYRGFILRSLGYDFDFATNFAFQLDNRGKRSITVDLEKPGGPELVRTLAANCDIFVTNLVQRRRTKYGMTYDEIKAVNPGVIYTSFSGYGTHGPDADRPGFDFAAFWARSGIMGILAEPDAPPPLCRGGQGDHTTALNILAATLAALRLRDKTGEGQHVELTLQGTGMWTIAGDYAAALAAKSTKQQPPRISRKNPVNPIWNSYRTADDRWLLLVNPVPFPAAWPKFCQIAGKPEWAADPRWDTIMSLRAHSAMLTAECDVIFAAHDYAWWAAQLDAAGLIWAPVATMPEMVADPQVAEMGWYTTIDHPEYGSFETLDTPFKIYGAEVGVRGPAPENGQHTFEILAEAGIDGAELERLATAGVIG
ncbi:MAG: CaiB/BaiF CoA transferase family protein [Dehalococcoidia bacterium]